MSEEIYEQKLRAAEQTWDNMDVSKVRSVAWLSVLPVSKDIWRSFADGSGPHEWIKSEIQSKTVNPDDTLIELQGCALVCGDMQSESSFFSSSPRYRFGNVDGFDLSEESLKRVLPASYTFTPHKIDCNYLHLECLKYDLVVVNHGAHHISELGNFFEQVNNSLKATGIMYFYEWIGPLALQIPRRNQFFAKILLVTLFLPKTRTTHMGSRKGLQFIQDSPQSFDPSEACNSMEILPQINKHMDIGAIHFHGGLTYPIFEGIAQNVQNAQLRIRLIIRLERFLMRTKLVYPLFAVGTASRKSTIS